jgi:hypothetical protein
MTQRAWFTRREPVALPGVHRPVRKLSSRQIVILVGALVAALAGLDVGAQTRPAGPQVGQTLGPRLDFDLAAHALPPSVKTRARPPALALRDPPERDG